jgi:rhamnulokinase
MPSAFLAIDLGATSGRLMLGRLESGRLALTELHRFANEPVTYNGELHWNMPGLWREIRIGLDAVDSFHPGRVQSIGVDTWGVDYALIGEKGALLENPYHYRDARTTGVMERVCARAGRDRIYDETGVQFMPINTLYQLYAAQERTPRLLAAAHHLVTIPDLVNFWLTGQVACEYTNASTTQFLSRRTGSWSERLLRDLEIPGHLLTKVIQPGTLLGPLQDGVTTSSSLTQTLVGVPACHDTGSAVASIRASGDTAFISSGTWSLLGTEVLEPVVSPAARDLNFTNEGGVNGTIRLLKNITGLWILECCRREWAHDGVEFSWNELLDSVNAAQPARSLIDPDDPTFVRPASMTGAIDDFCRRTRQPVPRKAGEYARAIFESLALKYRYVLDQLQTITGRQFNTIRVIGGGAKNDLLNCFTAEATGCTVIAGPAEATALGNIAMQMVATGAVKSLDESRDIIQNSCAPVQFEPSAPAVWEHARKKFIDILSQGVAAPAE